MEELERLEAEIDALKKRQRSFANSIGVAMTNALTASQSIHYAYCHATNEQSKRHLVTAIHSTLIVAEQCRQEMKSWLEETP